MELLWIAAACGIAGLLAGRWLALLVPVALWSAIALFLVVNNGWTGDGWGDFGIAFNIVVAILSVALTALGVAARRTFAR